MIILLLIIIIILLIPQSMKQKERYENISYIGKIPKIMHTIWIQGYEEIPAENKKKYEQIKEMNSNWQFMFWDNEKIEEILKEYPSLSNIYNNSEKVNGMGNHFALKSDIARFVIMEKYGGLYFDMDFDCILDTDELFDKLDGEYEIFIASSSIDFLNPVENIITLPKYCSCFMAFRPNHPVWEETFKKIEEHETKQDIGSSLDRALQESDYKIKMFKKVKGHYSCEKDYICTTPTESSWNPSRIIIQNLNCKGNMLVFYLIIFFLFTKMI